MLVLTDLRHAYDGAPVLDLPALGHARLEVPRGQHLLLLGPSGSGKTTLLHVMAGLLRPTAGRVEIDGTDLYALDEAARDRFRGRHLGVVFQQHHLVRALTAEQNLRLAPTMAGLPDDAARAREVLATLDLAGKAGAYPHQLSTGQQQRVALGRAVMNRPAVVLADEPTASLDDARAAAVLDLLFAQAGAHGATLVVATHDRRVAERFAHRLDLAVPATPSPAA